MIGHIMSLCLTSNNKRLISGSEDSSIKIRELTHEYSNLGDISQGSMKDINLPDSIISKPENFTKSKN